MAQRMSATTDPPASAAGPLLGSPLAVAPFVLAVVVLSFGAYPLGGTAVLVAFLGAVLVMIAAIDIEQRIIPNRIVLPATAIVLAARVALGPGDPAQYVLAAIIAAVAMFLPRLVRRDAIGMGDVKLTLLIGSGLGWGTAWALALGFASVFPVAVVMMIRGGAAARKATIPMGPFLALGALIVLLGPALATH